jgi:hypothetical protein
MRSSVRHILITPRPDLVSCTGLDANSSPDRREQETVWKALHSTGLQSVWDSFFAADGSLLVDKRPSTTNKMRGPLSGQRQKMGEHMLGAWVALDPNRRPLPV